MWKWLELPQSTLAILGNYIHSSHMTLSLSMMVVETHVCEAT